MEVTANSMIYKRYRSGGIEFPQTFLDIDPHWGEENWKSK